MIPIIKSNENLSRLNTVLNRSQFNFKEVNDQVERIIENVKNDKDLAVKRYTKTYDGVDIESFKITEEQITRAFENLDKEIINDLTLAAANIKRFHEQQITTGFTLNLSNDSTLTYRVKPIETVGIYVPGGKAAYPSTVLMNAIPAQIAGVKKIIMITPPSKDGSIKDSLLVAAKIAGVSEIYTVGGAQGIAALTYGTESIPKVDKIVGPGNIYVAIAKKNVSGVVGIDMIAGPSEILIIADEYANPEYIAADLMSQAEHDELASSILLTPSSTLANAVQNALVKQLQILNRSTIIEASLKDYGAIIITKDLDEAIKFANIIAPEHLEILTENPESLVDLIENAGAIFLGEYTPEPVGDYFAGPNHTLPTSATSRFSSALSTTDFYKKTSIIKYSKETFMKAKDSIIRLAIEEGLTAHANAIQIRK
ncbi:histidinol dehydrogenase [Liberiplasma polymorphum]|uniref:histidinol dehydrogenase n=1 Tax=Liberiplasma polymorphum TaxID=3374570 RepID=UPI00377307D3